MILVITNKNDITTDLLIHELNLRGFPYFRLNTEDIFRLFQITIFTKKNSFIIDSNGVELHSHQITSVYFRRPKMAEMDFSDWSQGEVDFYFKEMNSFWDGFYRLLEEKFWINNVFAIRNTENKLFQQKIANEIGLITPAGVVTSTPSYAKSFLQRNEPVIAKAIRTGFVDGDHKVIYTSRVSQSEDLSGIALCPTYLQEEIQKKSDIRVTLVGNSCYATEIDSQNVDNARVDWRRSVEQLPHSPMTLPDDIAKKVHSLQKYFNLYFAALDFVLTKNNEFVFLEINPNGQWGWIEALTPYRISKEIADSLIQHGGG